MGKKYVKELHLSNHKKHPDLTLKIEGRSFIVAGKNGAGKSTILAAINRLIGKESPTVKGVPKPDDTPEYPVTTGKESGFIKLKLTDESTGQPVDYTVEERFTKKGKSRIKFYRLAGPTTRDELNPAQERLKQIFGNVVDFTPLMDLSGVKQFEFLQGAFKLDVSGYIMKRENLVEDRRIARDRIKQIKAKLVSEEFRIGASDMETYKEEKSVKQLLENKTDLKPIQEKIRAAEKVQEIRKGYRTRIADNKRRIEELNAEIARITQNNILLNTQLDNTPEPLMLTLNSELIDAERHNALIDEQLTEVADHNKKVFLVKSVNESKAELEKEEQKEATSHTAIKDLDGSLRKRISEIPFSEIYEGLGLKYELDDNNKVSEIGLFLRDLPFHKSQQSFGEMIKVIIKLSTFINPDGLNFISIGQWNELDSENKQEILAFAKENENVQLGIEKVDDTTEIVTEFIEN